MYALKSEGSTGPRRLLAAAHRRPSSSCWLRVTFASTGCEEPYEVGRSARLLRHHEDTRREGRSGPRRPRCQALPASLDVEPGMLLTARSAPRDNLARRPHQTLIYEVCRGGLSGCHH